MSRADSKNKSQAMAHYMKAHPHQFPDSVSGGGWNGMARRLSAVPAAQTPEAVFNRGWLGGLLAHKLGWTCPLTDRMIEAMKRSEAG
jgi:hypothetical protein